MKKLLLAIPLAMLGVSFPAKGKAIVNAVNQPHGPPDPVWFGTQEWLYGDESWPNTFGEQYRYIVFR